MTPKPIFFQLKKLLCTPYNITINNRDREKQRDREKEEENYVIYEIKERRGCQEAGAFVS